VYPIISVLGPNIAIDPALALKLVRLVSTFYADNEWRFRSNFTEGSLDSEIRISDFLKVPSPESWAFILRNHHRQLQSKQQ